MAEETKDVSPAPEEKQEPEEEMDSDSEEDPVVQKQDDTKEDNDVKKATPKKEEKEKAKKEEKEKAKKEEREKAKKEEKEKAKKEEKEKAKKEEKEKANDDGDEEEDDDDEEESDEELQAGLLERPVVIEDGRKRERKKVERMTFQSPESDEKKMEFTEGEGTKLGDIPFVEFKINGTKSEDLKPLHRLLFKRPGAATTLKKNLRKFSGFPFPKSDSEYEKRLQTLKSNKYTIAMLKKIMEILNIQRNGTKDEMIERLMAWLLKPEDFGKKVPQKRKRSKKGKEGKDKKKTKKTKTKTKKSKATAEDDDDDDDDDEDNDDDEDADNKEKEDKDEESEEDKEESDEENESESEAEEEPPKKKKKVSPKPTPKPKKQKEKPMPKAKATPKKKPTPAKKKKEVASDDEVSDISSDSDDDAPLKPAVKSKGPPTNDEIKDFVKKMLENADLETVTMKTVLKDVYAKYPTFDLSDRKNFIKDTVKQVSTRNYPIDMKVHEVEVLGKMMFETEFFGRLDVRLHIKGLVQNYYHFMNIPAPRDKDV